MGSHYQWLDFEADADAFMQSIQNEVQSATRPGAEEDELVSEVVNSPEWFL